MTEEQIQDICEDVSSSPHSTETPILAMMAAMRGLCPRSMIPTTTTTTPTPAMTATTKWPQRAHISTTTARIVDCASRISSEGRQEEDEFEEDAEKGWVCAPSVFDRVERIVARCPCTEEVIALALELIDRAVSASPGKIRLCPRTASRIFAAALFVASKFHEDFPLRISVVCAAAEVTIRELCRTEVTFLFSIDFQIAAAAAGVGSGGQQPMAAGTSFEQYARALSDLSRIAGRAGGDITAVLAESQRLRRAAWLRSPLVSPILGFPFNAILASSSPRLIEMAMVPSPGTSPSPVVERPRNATTTSGGSSLRLTTIRTAIAPYSRP